MKHLYTNGFNLILVTAREARWRELTENWLKIHDIPWHDIIMRKDLDYRADSIVKQEMCEDLTSKYSIRLAIDDRDDILAIWAGSEIPTIKVGSEGQLSAISWPYGKVDSEIADIVE